MHDLQILCLKQKMGIKMTVTKLINRNVHAHSIFVSRCDSLRATKGPIQVPVSKEALNVFLYYLYTNTLVNKVFTEEQIKEFAVLGSLFNFT